MIGVCKLRGMRRGLGEGRCPLCREDEDVIHILLKCSETRKWRERFFNRKWLIVNEEVTYKRINYTNVVELENIGKYLYRIRCNWENKISSI
jgi:hypothetical protein